MSVTPCEKNAKLRELIRSYLQKRKEAELSRKSNTSASRKHQKRLA